MDQVNQENELQKAIDDITKNSEGEQNADVAAGFEEQIQDQMGTPPVPEVPPAGEGPMEAMPPEGEAEGVVPIEPAPLGEVIDDSAETLDLGVPPTPEVPVAEAAEVVADDGGLTDESTEPAIEGVAMEEATMPEAGEEPVVVGAETVGVPEAGEVAPELSDMGGNDITSVKEAMLRDLFPIMDKVEMGAEEKFELYRTMLDSENDKSLIAGAYEVAKAIADEAARAEALLFLIKKADA